MAKEDLEALRDHYAATNERDFARAMSYYDDDVVLDVPKEAAFINTGTFEGREAVGDFFGDWFRSFDSDLTFEIKELTELDDGSILLVADNYARGRASGIELKGTVVWRYRMRDGKIIGVTGHESPEAAVRAATERTGNR